MTSQPLQALALATRTKAKRHRLRRQIRSGLVRVDDVILEQPEEMRSATVEFVLLSVHRVGKVKVRKICHQAQVSPLQRLDSLTVRQTAALVRAVRAYRVFGS